MVPQTETINGEQHCLGDGERQGGAKVAPAGLAVAHATSASYVALLHVHLDNPKASAERCRTGKRDAKALANLVCKAVRRPLRAKLYLSLSPYAILAANHSQEIFSSA